MSWKYTIKTKRWCLSSIVYVVVKRFFYQSCLNGRFSLSMSLDGRMFKLFTRGQTEISTWLLFQIQVRTFARTLCSQPGPSMCTRKHLPGSKIVQWSETADGEFLWVFVWLTWHAARLVWSLRARGRVVKESSIPPGQDLPRWTGWTELSPHSQLNPCSNATLPPSPQAKCSSHLFAI